MPRKETRTVLVQVRLSEYLVKNLDRLVSSGWYKSRTEAIEDAIRYLLLRFKTIGEAGKFVTYRVEGKLKDVNPLNIVADSNIRENIVEAFGTDEIDEVMKVLRRR